MAGIPDTNEISAAIMACQNADAVQHIANLAQQRVNDIMAARSGGARQAVKTAVVTNDGDAIPIDQGWIQPTDQGHPQPSAAPMAGPAVEALLGQIGPSRGVGADPRQAQQMQKEQQREQQARQGAAGGQPPRQGARPQGLSGRQESEQDKANREAEELHKQVMENQERQRQEAGSQGLTKTSLRETAQKSDAGQGARSAARPSDRGARPLTEETGGSGEERQREEESRQEAEAEQKVAKQSASAIDRPARGSR